MENSKEQQILGVIIDNKLNLESHISELCRKLSQKIAALSRLSSHLHNSEKNLILNSIIKSQFSYCPLEGVHVTIVHPAFCLFLYLTGIHF